MQPASLSGLSAFATSSSQQYRMIGPDGPLVSVSVASLHPFGSCLSERLQQTLSSRATVAGACPGGRFFGSQTPRLSQSSIVPMSGSQMNFSQQQRDPQGSPFVGQAATMHMSSSSTVKVEQVSPPTAVQLVQSGQVGGHGQLQSQSSISTTAQHSVLANQLHNVSAGSAQGQFPRTALILQQQPSTSLLIQSRQAIQQQPAVSQSLPTTIFTPAVLPVTNEARTPSGDKVSAIL
ncbi:unnamed protein product [Soboliphyme baturini]|uniref:HIPK2 n=1 Tax=Soboliphyme baturini TaxID=241478 RepID=A0A183IU62_9BILA|nr:unnamed protein product [Soboliphyme baturini]